MLVKEFLILLLLSSLFDARLQIHLHLTNYTNEDEYLQHDCLRVSAPIEGEFRSYQVISYCMGGVFPSQFRIESNSQDQKFTFEQLAKRKISSKQLYLWSAPIDLIEEYQSYLNQPDNFQSTSIFYNCTLPYFGSQCQYRLHLEQSNDSSLEQIIHDYYHSYEYEPTQLTCYMHLECVRGSSPACLDWTEICDGKVDCIDDGFDEEYCWQVIIHQCQDDEHACSHGQCIPLAFKNDHFPDCLDQSDEEISYGYTYNLKTNLIAEPTFQTEDILCTTYTTIGTRLNSFTNSCFRNRRSVLIHAMFSVKPTSLSDECWAVLKCTLRLLITQDQMLRRVCRLETWKEIVDQRCPDIIPATAMPVLYGHIYFIIVKNKLLESYIWTIPEPTYFCYDNQLLYILDEHKQIRLSDNRTCRLYSDVKGGISEGAPTEWIRFHLERTHIWLRRRAYSPAEDSRRFNHSLLYKCLNSSKQVSNHHLLDNIPDCYNADDERWPKSNRICSPQSSKKFFKCRTMNECIPHRLVQNGDCHCTRDEHGYCEDEDFDYFYAKYHIQFSTICDGYVHLKDQLIDDQYENDETDCEHWPLIHIYNRCDGFWHNLNGSDELNCYPPVRSLNCSIDEYLCVSIETTNLICLPMENINDGFIDCIGGADESELCRKHAFDGSQPKLFCCSNSTDKDPCVETYSLCDNTKHCTENDDEQFCQHEDLIGISDGHGICTQNYEFKGSDISKVICRHFNAIGLRWKVYFTLDQQQDLLARNQRRVQEFSSSSIKKNIQSYQPRCHRGLDLQVWLDKTRNYTRNVCLCPPSFYGDHCQYQNQRVTLSIQFRVTSDSVNIPLMIIISLIDDSHERRIHSSEQLTYLSWKHCQRKFHIYLLYSKQPKDLTRIYSIHIDVYEKFTLDYRASFLLTLNYSFLPVHRLVIQLDIPSPRNSQCEDDLCQHGQCRIYANNLDNETFCQCDRNWSGRFCNISSNSLCSIDSIYLGQFANNRSLCLCPVTKIGLRCLIPEPICHKNQTVTCFNQGQCLFVDQLETSSMNFICLCPKEYTGDRCEISQTKLTFLFDERINLPSSILVHFIETKLDASPIRTTTFKTTSFGQHSVTIYWSLPFHLIFVELSKENSYLSYLEKTSRPSQIIELRLNSSDRCLSLNEIFDNHTANQTLLRRIKSYHRPCQNQSLELKCFYDDKHFCFCQQGVTNCLEFNHEMSFNCSGQSGCENLGRCFQEQTTCPRTSICQCPICYYGTRCQFSTNTFSLSLDAILGFHIRPDLNLSRQSSAVIISLIITIIITILGVINGILSLITFREKSTRESGCGLYLLTSSIMILIIMIIFLLKFIILLYSQMKTITNRIFLNIQCHSIDFLLRSSLEIDQWLTTFVAIERALIIVKGIHFNKEKYRTLPKWIIPCLIFITLLTNIPDPIYRRLYHENDNNDEQRIWCIVNYSPIIRMVNYVVNLLHFLLPFLINIISALVIIFFSTRQQVQLKQKKKKKKKTMKIFYEQIHQHRQLLIGPCVLIILAIPRLIISFTSGCMKSTSDSWLFLWGYFISFIPSLLTFLVFVLPSTTYKQAFRKAISRYRRDS